LTVYEEILRLQIPMKHTMHMTKRHSAKELVKEALEYCDFEADLANIKILFEVLI